MFICTIRLCVYHHARARTGPSPKTGGGEARVAPKYQGHLEQASRGGVRTASEAATSKSMPSPRSTAALVSGVAVLLLLLRARRRRRHIISDEQWEQFDREGFVVLPPEQVFDDARAELAALQSRVDDIMLGKADVPYECMMMQLDSSSGQCRYAGLEPAKGLVAC
jgi:hypothetical protein